MNRLAPLLSLLIGFACDFQDEPTIPESPWELAQPSDVGVDESQLLIGDNKIRDGIYGSIKSLIILKDDKLIFENYYQNEYQSINRNDLVDIQGSAVAISAIAAGILLDQNIVPGLNTPIEELLNDKTPFADPLRAQIDFEHLISMRAGIAWNELLRPFNDPRNSAGRMSARFDWAAFALQETMEAVPGGRFAYSSGTYMILSKIVREQTGKSLAEFTQENLFDPLEIEYTWGADPSGFTTGAWGLNIMPRSMAKIGYLALNGGNWFGNQIVSEEYIDEMGALQSQYTFNHDFGYGWWRFSDFSALVGNLEENDIFFSWGTGGQFIFVIPYQNMVVATTAFNFPPEGNERLAFSLLFEDIIPSIREEL